MATKIPWATETANPFNGCTKVSEGCKNCYAMKLARRLKAMGNENYQHTIDDKGHWTGAVNFNFKALDKITKWKKQRMIFLCSMGDMFHNSISDYLIQKVIHFTQQNYPHIFIILTKRPERMYNFFRENINISDYLENVWLGVTAENQEQADIRIPILLKTPGVAKRFVSIEPMLGPVNLTQNNISPLLWSGYTKRNLLTGILSNSIRESHCSVSSQKLDWVICGCESGTGRRPMDIEWVRNLKNQCVSASVPFFFKQEYAGSKKISMPTLDGQIWDQYPETK